ncbi:uncharacterized protein [Aristolochia californica]|uniref:uncharacterized protein isoform X2 n=1 Tax=Aristolochia californica TaxID=171875 RepID=UPI0035DA60FE
MAMDVDAETQNPTPHAMEVEEKEGRFLLGSPTFVELGDGRFKCVETGHELPAREMESYGNSKRCRLGIIDSAIRLKKAPLNFFKQDPASKSKLICKLTGDSINKSEEHIWKHISGKRFQKQIVGNRWDNDQGNDRWEDSANPGKEGDEYELPEEDESDLMESEDLPTRTKRTSVAVGPSSYASRKKKNKSKFISTS